jgi:hypothetical protein
MAIQDVTVVSGRVSGRKRGRGSTSRRRGLSSSRTSSLPISLDTAPREASTSLTLAEWFDSSRVSDTLVLLSIDLHLDQEELVAKKVEFGEPGRLQSHRAPDTIPPDPDGSGPLTLQHMSRAVVRVIGGHNRWTVDQRVTWIGS